ncbi:MAG: hypothetical protein COB46_03520 [Rhodospirillaceae bacterium]|nr:MAG: hypothetical protein COB46_03520 [Rhodospirillaceae bacterium]
MLSHLTTSQQLLICIFVEAIEYDVTAPYSVVMKPFAVEIMVRIGSSKSVELNTGHGHPYHQAESGCMRASA